MGGLLKAAAAVLVMVVVVFGVWLALERGRQPAGPTGEAESQATAAPAPASRPAILRGDAATMAMTETATFALG